MTAIDLEKATHTAQVAALKSLIGYFFDAINASDPKGLQKLFYPGARVGILKQEPPRAPAAEGEEAPLATATVTSSEKGNATGPEKLVVVIRTDIETFVKLLEDGEKKRREGGGGGGEGGKKGGPDVIREVPDLDKTEVRTDGLFATAWCPFRVYFDGVLHHYGTFVFTFGYVQLDAGVDSWIWRIEGLTQSYRRTIGWEGAREEL